MAGSSGIAAMGIPNAIRGLWCSRTEPATHRGMTIPLTGTRAGRLSGFFFSSSMRDRLYEPPLERSPSGWESLSNSSPALHIQAPK